MERHEGRIADVFFSYFLYFPVFSYGKDSVF